MKNTPFTRIALKAKLSVLKDEDLLRHLQTSDQYTSALEEVDTRMTMRGMTCGDHSIDNHIQVLERIVNAPDSLSLRRGNRFILLRRSALLRLREQQYTNTFLESSPRHGSDHLLRPDAVDWELRAIPFTDRLVHPEGSSAHLILTYAAQTSSDGNRIPDEAHALFSLMDDPVQIMWSDTIQAAGSITTSVHNTCGYEGSTGRSAIYDFASWVEHTQTHNLRSLRSALEDRDNDITEAQMQVLIACSPHWMIDS